ncbi:hypothetical protein FACS189485_02910 [Spirochaetia bacterium]|nr:hypothetical protein FACS189485_02910 [Spirochaetia bacterium]
MIRPKKALGIVLLLLSAACLLTVCDWNPSIGDFTGNETAGPTGFTLCVDGRAVPLTDSFILIPPAGAGTPSLFELSFAYNSTRELAFQAHMAKNGAEPTDVTVTTSGSHTVKILVEGAAAWDRFTLTLRFRTADGFRDFDDFDDFVFPPIYCADPGNSVSGKAILAFNVTETGGLVSYAGEVDNTALPKTVTISVPYGTAPIMDVSVIHTGASISDGVTTVTASPAVFTGVNFTSMVEFTVRAADGSTEIYEVTVTPGTLTSREITSFRVKASETAIWYAGEVDNTALPKTVTISVPYGTAPIMDVSVIHTGASISVGVDTVDASPADFTGVNFTYPVEFTVTAADGSSTEIYEVTVNVGNGPDNPPATGGPYVAYRAAAIAPDNGFYTSIQGAVGAATNGTEANPDTIILIANEDINSTTHPVINILANKHIRLTSSTNKAINRGAGVNGSLITVIATGSLELAGNLVIDGGAANTPSLPATAALITVSGKLKMGGSVTLKDNNNAGGNGGGVAVNGGTFEMSGGSITGNTATNGGGVYVDGGYVDGGYVGGTFTMSGTAASTKIIGNQATNGGGVYVYNGSRFIMSGGTIGESGSSNTATNGGGVYVYNGSRFIMIDGTIESNAVNSGKGGGVYITGNNDPGISYFTKYGGTIDDNNSASSVNGPVLYGRDNAESGTSVIWTTSSGPNHIGTMKVDGGGATANFTAS